MRIICDVEDAIKVKAFDAMMQVYNSNATDDRKNLALCTIFTETLEILKKGK